MVVHEMTCESVEPPVFSHSNKPQALPTKRTRAKYREEELATTMSNNIMFDRRVVRGNTYQAQVTTTNSQRENERLRKEQEMRIAREKVLLRYQQSNKRPNTPAPVDGREHMIIQTDDYLEELTNRPLEKDADSQTQAFLDRPPSPLYVIAKCGEDTATQIEVGDLFDFDTEVVPILEVLIGKTLELSMLEIMEEEELEALRKRQQEFETIRNAEVAEVQRLEAEAKRRDDEKLQRLEQEKIRLRKRQTLEEKVAARSYAKQYLAVIQDTIFKQLEEEGVFYDPVKKEVKEQFLPWVMEQVSTNITQVKVAEKLFRDSASRALEKVRKLQVAAKRERDEELARMSAEAADMAREEERMRMIVTFEKQAAAEATIPEPEEEEA